MIMKYFDSYIDNPDLKYDKNDLIDYVNHYAPQIHMDYLRVPLVLHTVVQECMISEHKRSNLNTQSQILSRYFVNISAKKTALF